MYSLPNERGVQADVDHHTRFTTVCSVAGDGVVLPVAFIINNSIKLDNQSRQRVLSNLLADRREFNSDGGWELRTWSKTLNVRKKNKGDGNKMVDVKFTRPYLIHRDGRVVWSQHNAYMDTPSIVMYGDLVLGLFRARSKRVFFCVG